MTPNERDLLSQFLSDLAKTTSVAKDPEAAAMIDRAMRANPDAAYVLVQHALLADQALHQAQAQIAAMQSGGQPQGGSSFLAGGGLGPRLQPQAQPQPLFGAGPFGGASSGLGSFLQSAATTAAGVAGGEFLFEGLSNLFGGHRGFGGFGGFGGGMPMENITINNYGDSDGGDFGDSDSGDY